jgi:AbrB family looped-hinge helix DNA binding protein
VLTVRLRAKHQITLPSPVVKRLGLREGDALVVSVEEGRATLRPVRPSYKGVLGGRLGRKGGIAAFLRAERASWRD